MKKTSIFIIPRDCRKCDDGALIVIKNRIDLFKEKCVLSKVFVHENCEYDELYQGFNHSREINLYKIFNIFKYRIPPIVSFYFEFKFLLLISNYIRSHNVDSVYIEHLHLSFYGKFLKVFFPKIEIVLFHHNVESELFYSFYKRENNVIIKSYWYINFYLTKLYESKLFWIDKNVFISEYDRNLFLNLHPVSSFCCHLEPFVDLNRFHFIQFSEKKERVIVGFIGSLDYYPNEDGVKWFLENVYKKFFIGNDNLEFLIVGKNPPESIKIYSKIYSNISVTGWVKDDLEFFQKIDIFISPIFAGGGIKIKILNALAAKKCIISTSFSCKGITGLESYENIIFADSSIDFKQEILRLSNDYSKRLEISKSGFEFAKKLSDKYFDSLNSI